MKDDDFYIGYQPQAPSGLRRFLTLTVAGLLVLAVILAVVLVSAQQPFAASAFEFGNITSHTGIVVAQPQPMLLVARPGEAGSEPAYSAWLLVLGGKHGAHDWAASFDGQRVEVEGTLIYRDGLTMLELREGTGTLQPGPQAADLPANLPLGTHTLRGEIVDSKCYFGVMNPGETKVHRACASLCIRGGIPPVLAVRDPDGHRAYFLVQGPDGEAINADLLDVVAEPVAITGDVARLGDHFVVRTDPTTIRALSR